MYIAVNEIAVTNLKPEEKNELEGILLSELPFDVIMPVPTYVSNNPELERQWKENNWGTEGLLDACVELLPKSDFGEKSDESTVIFGCDTITYAPYGIVSALSRKYPASICTIRSTTDEDPSDGGSETVFRNGEVIRNKQYSFSNKKKFYDFLLKLYGSPDFYFD